MISYLLTDDYSWDWSSSSDVVGRSRSSDVAGRSSDVAGRSSDVASRSSDVIGSK